MSGFEVAGLALGAIPIVVSGLELSIRGITTLNKWRAYRRHIDNLILDLETEHCKLKNVLEHLLEGIAPSEQIEEMIRDPFGPSWHDKAIQAKVQQRLWNSDKVFRRHIVRIREAVEELKVRLGIDESFTEKAPVCLHFNNDAS